MAKVLDSVPEKAKAFLSGPKKMLIDGEWVEGASGKTFETINPANGEVITTIYEAGEEDVDKAVRAARKAFKGPWSKFSPAERARALHKLADLMEEHQDELTYLETIDFGSVESLSRHAWVLGAAEHIRYYAGWATKLNGETMSLTSGGNKHAYTVVEPVGVCGQITSWNFPLLGVAWKLAPALAAGNTTVLKPSQNTSLSTLYLATLIEKAGIPEGVVNIVTGGGSTTGEYITSHKDIDKVAFTGSTSVGKHILRKSADTLKKVTLELGGKSPHIIFADANLEKAVQHAFFGFTMNQGEVCAAGTRVYVERSVYQEVTDQLVELAKNMKVGDPFDPAAEMGPLVSKEQFDRVSGYVKLAEEEGGRILVGGKAPEDENLKGGYYFEPTIIADVDEHCRVVTEEIFGPVLCIMPFDDVDEVIERGNLTEYGLSSGVHTRDINKAHKVISALDAGTVWVNGYMNSNSHVPLGGFKQSGVGAEMGYPGIEIYTKSKSVVIDLDDE
ncbi:aldehyde dehydrogenase family protein [Salinicoccus halitifaciens]|uniref:Aldehyde dehydrogenase (NAD+)/phenylacetaldehyde dehydrogenase n=1 Tax=Salinicoccus halitifaciens TaxID=1073415 RepID=A0ABV2EB27_9STAP|nr:aldehyde dehydrogenase family protein [Salinicoccus halitifaciens]MCD2137541.1 aldehyde dehydrogenase family protein [Salinicoccus halitifaciens]